jgi:putative endonuclease
MLESTSENQARLIEKHIKKMKSKTYIHNLVKYPEIAEKLLLKFRD